MKIRTSFVTNSSSSSFVLLKTKSKTLYDILAPHRDYLEAAVSWLTESESDHEFSLSIIDQSDFCQDYFPDSVNGKQGLVNAWIGFFSDSVYFDMFDDDGELISDFKPNLENPDEGDILALDILSHRTQIEEDIEEAEIELTDFGWGEDDSRFCTIDENRRESIAEELNLPTEEISDERYFEEVEEMSSSFSQKFLFNRNQSETPVIETIFEVS